MYTYHSQLHFNINLQQACLRTYVYIFIYIYMYVSNVTELYICNMYICNHTATSHSCYNSFRKCKMILFAHFVLNVGQDERILVESSHVYFY